MALSSSSSLGVAPSSSSSNDTNDANPHQTVSIRHSIHDFPYFVPFLYFISPPFGFNSISVDGRLILAKIRGEGKNKKCGEQNFRKCICFVITCTAHTSFVCILVIATANQLVDGWIDIESSVVLLPSSCVGREDDHRWLTPYDGEEFPAVHQFCCNEFMVIDVAEDTNVAAYFSSFTAWHYALSGPTAMDSANWEQWWLPSACFLAEDGRDGEYFQFAIAPEYDSCAAANDRDTACRCGVDAELVSMS